MLSFLVLAANFSLAAQTQGPRPGRPLPEPVNPGQTATLAQVNGVLDSIRLPIAPGQTVGALPLSFFSVRIPEGFASRNANSFDIRTLEGLKLYRARQVYDTNFGTLFANNAPRYIQFGVRVFF